MTFPFLFYEKRTHETFKSKLHLEHHLENKQSPFLKLKNFDVINQFILNSMHMVDLGVMKKLLKVFWMPGSGSSTRLDRNQILQVSQRLMNSVKQIPLEFQRTTRSLGDLAN